jgi:hypothetical protein
VHGEQVGAVEVLEDVGEHDDVEVARGDPPEYVSLVELEVGVVKAAPGEREVVRIVVDANNNRTGNRDEVKRDLALATSDVEYTLASIDALDEKVVVARQSVLDVNAVVVPDCRLIDSPIGVVVQASSYATRSLLTPRRVS